MRFTAKDISGWEGYYHSEADVETLHRLARMLPDRAVVTNIGAGLGTSALAMLEARQDLFILSIDTMACRAEQKHLREAGLYGLHRVARLLGKSYEIGEHWPWLVDMVFVDGGHDYESVRLDIETWIPKVKRGGIIAFHDYGPGGRHHIKAIKDVVDALMGGYEVILHEETIKAFWQKG